MNPQKPVGSDLQPKMEGENIPQINENAILGFRNADQKIGSLFLSTKCVNLNGDTVLIFFKLWKTMENSMNNQ